MLAELAKDSQVLKVTHFLFKMSQTFLIFSEPCTEHVFQMVLFLTNHEL